MFRNYIKVAVRTLMKNKLFTLINVFGLALSMSICMLVLIGLKDQLGYDKFHPRPERIYRIISQLTNKQGNSYRFATSPLPFANNFTAGYDLIETSTRVYIPGSQRAIGENNRQFVINGAFADASFFDVFGFPFKDGNKTVALKAPNSIVLTHAVAEKMFGAGVDAIGKTIEYPTWGNFVVTGVLAQPIGKSHLDYDAYLSMSSVVALEKAGKLTAMSELWDNFFTSYTYVVTKKGISRSQLNRAVEDVSTKLMAAQKNEGSAAVQFEAQPFKKIIVGEELIAAARNTGSRSKVWGPVAIGFIILLSACFNYTNLSIARSLKRGKEVGIRKVSGAMRRNVFFQFIIESLLLAFIAFGFAFLFLRVMIDYLPFIAESIPQGFTFDWSVFVWFFLFTLFAGFLAGSLPAWTLSSFKPVQVLKNLSNVKLFGSNGLRNSLIVVQFSLALVIVIFTLVFSRQFDYLAN
ncbi:MAG: ABC transporter permease, partial [Chitinophagaceae bacterium]|nr:ABC transporter permease [Chitinophagaceae bacterium]